MSEENNTIPFSDFMIEFEASLNEEEMEYLNAYRKHFEEIVREQKKDKE